MTNNLLKILILSTLFVWASPAWSYNEGAVSNGGSITGKVILNGEKPNPQAFNLVTFPEPVFCGRISNGKGWRLLDEFQVAPDGGLQDTVVMLEGIHHGKPFEVTVPTIEAEDCTLSPNVNVVRDNSEIRVVNMDPILHDVQLYETAPFGSEVMFHRPLRLNPHHPKDSLQNHEHLPGETLVDTIRFSKGRRIFFFECGFHAYMQSWGIAVTNPYYPITDEQGNFSITDIPEGMYTLVAWHPGMRGILDMKVVVLADETLKTRFEFEASTNYQSRHTTLVEKPHFGLGALGEPLDIKPTHELQEP